MKIIFLYLQFLLKNSYRKPFFRFGCGRGFMLVLNRNPSNTVRQVSCLSHGYESTQIGFRYHHPLYNLGLTRLTHIKSPISRTVEYLGQSPFQKQVHSRQLNSSFSMEKFEVSILSPQFILKCKSINREIVFISLYLSI